MDAPVARGAPRSQGPGWGELVRRNWPQYIATLFLLGLVKWTDTFRPYDKPLYGGSDAELWRLSYPHMHESIPDYVVPVFSLVIPSVVICLFVLVTRGSRAEIHHALLMLFACVLTTALFTNIIKVQVGRPRPDFVYHCWRHHTPKFDKQSRPICLPDVDQRDLDKARRSFPSGHTSWTAAGLGFLSIWLMGRFRCFNGAPQPARLVFCLAPLFGVLFVAMNRIRECKHHVEDVIGGSALGLTLAYAFYREVFAGLFSPAAGRLVTEAKAQEEQERAAEADAEERRRLLGDRV